MDAKTKILDIIDKRVMILDGASGTEIQKRGIPAGACPELWCLEEKKTIRAIHHDYCEAGADVIFTCTFGANIFKLSQYKATNVTSINRELALLARQSVDNNTLVAGDIGPTGRFIEPFGDLGFDEAVDAFKDQVKGLIQGGVDLFIIETMMDIQEARAALIAVKEVSDLFCMVTMTYEDGGRTLNGTDPVSALITLQSLGADAVGCNCSTGPEGMIPLIAAMKPHATIPLVAKPNAGIPRLENAKTFFDMSPETFGSHGSSFISAGVNILGGCCGTAPEHIQNLKAKIHDLPPQPPERIAISALSSSTKTVFLRKEKRLMIIGERINPTGKKELQEELVAGKMSKVRRIARQQVKDGATLLDVNVGMPDIDETQTMKKVVGDLASIINAPLVIDSSNIEAIEAALRIYPGRALINSISGEQEKLGQLLKIARKYGSMFILLPLTGKKMPKTCADRIPIIEDIYCEALSCGFTKQDIIIDALTMAVSADQEAAVETLETVKWSSKTFGCLTVMGLSNVSFGLPMRKWINAAFAAMASFTGLNLAIANPSVNAFMDVSAASDVLINRDKQANAYIQRFSDPETQVKPRSTQTEKSTGQQVYTAVVEGDREEITLICEKAMAEGMDPQGLISDIMIPAIRQVGELYDQKIYFLPQLIASAESMKKGFEYLEPLLKASMDTQETPSKIILATVKGDIHDIGKNIVALMLKNHGFTIIDLGKNVPHETLIDAIKEHDPAIVGLSALMTTTMVNMKEAIELARHAGITCKFMVGGAVVTRSFAESIGAHYSKDGVDAVRVAQQLTAKGYIT